MSHDHRTFVASLLLAGAPLVAPTNALGADFSSTGELVPASDTLVFDGLEANAGGLPVQVGNALEKSRFARLEPGQSYELERTLPTGPATIRVRLFQRGALAATYASTADGVYAPLYPTGRVTSDEWVELASAPVSAGDASVRLTFRNAAAQPVDVDGIEIAFVGPPTSASSCRPPRDSICEGGACLAGRCVPRGQRIPPLPPEPVRSALPGYFTTMFDAHFGGLATRRDNLPDARERLVDMAQAQDAEAYWGAFRGAFHALRDSHSAAFVGVTEEPTLPVCFVVGDGDRSHDTAPADAIYPDILVSHVLANQSGVLTVGDRLVAIDGQHPIAFARTLADVRQGVIYATDPHALGGVVRDLATIIRTHASTITVVRCAGTQVCGPPHVLEVTSLPSLAATETLGCDQRPAYHQTTSPSVEATHDLGSQVFVGPLNDATPNEPGFYGLLFDSLYPRELPSPFTKAFTMLQANATHVVLDHRLGTGGLTSHVSQLSALWQSPRRVVASTAPLSFTSRSSFGPAEGGLIHQASDDAFEVGAPKTSPGKAALRVAVLLARDLSASDFLALGMKNESHLRTFGSRTDGAFSTLGMVSWGGGTLVASFGSGDAFGPDGQAMVGRGVVPDEEIVPRQSDLIAHVDTVYERALAWLRAETEAP